MKIIVFGATGTIGAYSTMYFKDKGYDVIAVGKRESDNGFFAINGIPYYSVDISNKNDFSKLEAIEQVDIILHLAGVMPAAMKGYEPRKYIDSIVIGTLNVLNFALKTHVKKIIFSQSRADSNYLMGKKPIPSDIVKKFPLTGDHAVYSICKNAAVDMIEHYYYQYKLKRFILRLPTIYAYHPNKYFYVDGIKKTIAYRLIMDKAMKGEDVEIWGDPSKAKEIVYIDDALQLFEKCVISEMDGGMYNLGGPAAVSLEEQIKGIVDVFSISGVKSKIIYCPDKPDAREFVNDISKTRHDLGYEPRYDYNSLLLAFKKEMELQRFKGLWGEERDYDFK